MPPSDLLAEGPRADDRGLELADADGVRLWIASLADQIASSASGPPIVLIGIPRRGVPLAERLARAIHERHAIDSQVERLDPTLWRDDFDAGVRTIDPVGSPQPAAVEGRRIVLVDDVIWTGRTARAALDHLMALGRPARVEFAVLVDRSGREVPLQPTFSAHRDEVAPNDIVEVRLTEVDGFDGVYVRGRARRER